MNIEYFLSVVSCQLRAQSRALAALRALFVVPPPDALAGAGIFDSGGSGLQFVVGSLGVRFRVSVSSKQ